MSTPLQFRPIPGNGRAAPDAMTGRTCGAFWSVPQPQPPMAQPGERARIALEAAGIGCLDLHVASGRLECDVRLRDIWRVPPDAPMTLKQLIDGVHPDDRPLAQATLQGPFDPERRSPRVAEYRLQDVRGDERWVRATVSVCFEQGRALRLIGTAQDIGAEHAQRTAQAAGDGTARDESMMMVAHELRGPLSPILASGHLLAQWAEDPLRVRRIAGIVTRQATQMSAILDALLGAGGPAPAQAAGALPVAAPSALRAALDIAVETASPAIAASHQALVVEAGAGLRTLAIDPVQVSQIVSNLLINASKYTDPGGRIVLRAQARGDGLVLSVQDNGIGITRSALPRLFRMYCQVHGDERRAGGGHGIGLALVKRLAERHGGTVEARSDGPGTGSEFIVHLPRALVAHPAGAGAEGRAGPSRPVASVGAAERARGDVATKA